MPTPPNRRAYIDWMRGLSVLFMVEIHTIDSWTLLADRKTTAYFVADFIGGLAANVEDARRQLDSALQSGAAADVPAL